MTERLNPMVLKRQVEALKEALEAAEMARKRLETFADLANSGQAQAGGRELKRQVWGAFREFDEVRAALSVEGET